MSARRTSLHWEPQMNRLAFAILAIAAVTAPGLTAVPIVAQTKMDCSRLYKDFWEKLDREKFAQIPPSG